jgi:antitoxin component of MazEF toxin-antitoxin module
MVIEVKLKKWGSSIGLILPKEFVESKKYKVDDKVIINVVKESELKDVFGSLPRKKDKTTQNYKDELRKECN